MKILDIKQITNEKFLNYFNIKWKLDNGKENIYHLTSRKSLEDVKNSLLNHQRNTDAVRAVPYFYKDGEMHIVLIKEFRCNINDYLIGTPAGLIDAGETELEALNRELNEEIGATTKKVTKHFDACYPSVGLTDESVACFFVEIEPDFGNQHLEATEKLNYFTVKLSELQKTIKEVLDYQARYLLEVFYLEQENKKLQEQLKIPKK